MPSFEPWVIEGIRAGGWALVPFLISALMWVVKQHAAERAALTAERESHMRTIESLVPLVRGVDGAMGAIGRRIEALDLIVREGVAEARATRSRR